MLPKVKVLRPEGILDSAKSAQFRQQINELIDEGVNVVLIDLKKVTFMDSSGLGALVLILKTVRNSGGRLFLMSLNDQIKMLFDLTNMGSIFEIIKDKSELEERLRNP
ncbi:MAG: STAS domain-containing protein [Cyanobacteria bacterium]|nr:STAS domain-containing protein [Cyanobacteria bacterium CG_2015-16_32_12]NCO79428.1 STAS domain-containing protein [Cyanobacteria bacterium CG_2015-22_32_23]NCQ05594.1 STAS domain-containing protein [Cyanobacteria bacterium CG_2015-09_32_10]NCQ42322.1 STAS domain-containing protein [Cyanobacteria bacterium CG_2015-04_32_10]NCS85078.1 STAS domain-containing protein [Cyanobacteria bacterium CG_2015-02_32_10]